MKSRLSWPGEPIWYAFIYPQYDAYEPVQIDLNALRKEIKNYFVPPLHWNRYTRAGRDMLRAAGLTVKEAYLS